jgi:hypothetical protein
MLCIVFPEALSDDTQKASMGKEIDTLMQSRQGSLTKRYLGAATTTS